MSLEAVELTERILTISLLSTSLVRFFPFVLEREFWLMRMGFWLRSTVVHVSEYGTRSFREIGACDGHLAS